MRKKPLLLDKKKILASIDLVVTKKLIEQSLKNISDYYILYEEDFIEFLSKVFIYEPKLIILSKESFEESIVYAKHIRNNKYFEDLTIIIISEENNENSTNNKNISSLNIKHYNIPINSNELVRNINDALK